MRILYVITSLRLGGAERLVTDLAKNLSERGHQAEIFVMDSTSTPLSEELEKSGIKIHKGWKGYLNMWNPFCYFKLKSVVRKGNYDIVHSHNSMAQYIVAPLFKKSLLVTTEHTPSTRRGKSIILKRMDSLVYSRYKGIIAVSHSTRESLRRHLEGTPGHPDIRVIYNGVGQDYFKDGSEPRPKGRKDKIIVMVAGFRYPKDQPTLIKALSLLSEDYKLWLVGDGPLRKEAEEYVSQSGVSSRVRFWGFRGDVKELLRQSDIFVLSSRFEGMPIAVLEAMAMGVPVVASDVKGLSEIVKDAGYLFNAGDALELANKIRRILGDETLYKEISGKCRERAREFSVETTALNHEKLYSGLLKTR